MQTHPCAPLRSQLDKDGASRQAHKAQRVLEACSEALAAIDAARDAARRGGGSGTLGRGRGGGGGGGEGGGREYRWSTPHHFFLAAHEHFAGRFPRRNLIDIAQVFRYGSLLRRAAKRRTAPCGRAAERRQGERKGPGCGRASCVVARL